MGCNCKKTASAPKSSVNNTVRHTAPTSNGRLKGKIIRRIIK